MIINFLVAIVLQLLFFVCITDLLEFGKREEFGYIPRSFPAPHVNVISSDKHKTQAKVDMEFEPVIPNISDSKINIPKEMDCDGFTEYAYNCNLQASDMYNSTKKAPPLPDKLDDWCRALKHLTNCAIEWNSDCQDVTDSHFHEESIQGHMHVVTSICEKDRFVIKYSTVSECIQKTEKSWVECYEQFKKSVDESKNSTQEWTHFNTHFKLCCARTRFRRCTLDLFFNGHPACPYEQAVVLQKFSVIISEGDVYQDCEKNVLYSDCPGGDPRPSGSTLQRLTSPLSGNSSVRVEDRFFLLHLLCFSFLLLFK